MTLATYINSIKDKRIGVIGAGISNMPLITALCDSGCAVTVCDKSSLENLGENADKLIALGAKLKLGETYLDNLDFDIIFRTPGLHPFKPELVKARENGAIITSEMEVFFETCPCKIIAITGSDGKTTTSTLIAEILKAEGYTVWLGGNIGRPLLVETDKMESDDFAVLELSSFQLHSMTCTPDVAVVTNIAPNHLDIHPDYADYISAKENIFAHQNENCLLVVNEDNDITASFKTKAVGKLRTFSRKIRPADGFYFEDETVYKMQDSTSEPIALREEFRLVGDHNIENFMAAYCATVDYVSKKAFRKVAKNFKGVAHRMELVREVDGVLFYNDSIASSPSRTVAGLKSFPNKSILIAGGYDKHIPFAPLAEEAVKSVKAMVLCGDTAAAIYAAMLAQPSFDAKALEIVKVDDFKEAIYTARNMAEIGDRVLLSPASASFDKFKNFAIRGDTFRQIVLEME